MEAAWHAALILVPLFFNVYSSRIFEPDKLAILRSLALVILAAWLIRIIDAGWPQREGEPPGNSPLKALVQAPLVLPVAAFAGIILLATALSINPRTSLLGSYQRLQGAYTSVAYLILFASLALHLRRREQVERLITTLILVSLPISLYGVLQRYQIDPVPWGGNVSRRIAANMGNSIFVAAYLILAAPLTYGRIIQSFSGLMNQTGRLAAEFIRSTAYVFIAALQLIAIYLSFSRGPFLGWMAGVFFLFMLLSLHWGRRRITLGMIGLALAVGGFLVLLNLQGGPLEGLRGSAWIGRFGRLIDREQATSQVRILIWGGAAELVLPHEPLIYPDGSTDRLNALRPLVGYGPESMHVAYNRFFPPELARLEKRNASPDRSHNETWDALVTTGALGLAAELVLFGALFYYGLKWLGLIRTNRERWLFLGLCTVGGVAGAAGLVIWQGRQFFGVGLPMGMILGATSYLTLMALTAGFAPPESDAERDRDLLLIMLLSALVANFVEINFGIAIAATRTYFWSYAALLLVVGYVMPRSGELPASGASVEQAAQTAPAHSSRSVSSKRRKRGGRNAARSLRRDIGFDWREAAIGGLLVGLILATLGYDYINFQSAASSSLGVVWNSFTRLPNRGGAVSYGILALILTLWLIAGLVYTAEIGSRDRGFEWRTLAGMLGLSALTALLYWLWHASALIGIARYAGQPAAEVLVQARMFEGLLSGFYVFLLLVISLLGWLLPPHVAQRAAAVRTSNRVLAPALAILLIGLAVVTNLRMIQADMDFKLADPFARQGQFRKAIDLYQRASEFAPTEDHYLLFLGKTYLDFAARAEDPDTLDARAEQAEDVLLKAQRLNPLNADHTANLARLYRWWAGNAREPDLQRARAEISADYYERALTLSPNNVVLWAEAAALYLANLDDLDAAFDRLNRATEVDPLFDGAFALLGDYYVRLSQTEEDAQQKQAALEQAVENYRRALELVRPGASQSIYNYHVALGGAYQALGDQREALKAFQAALEAAPTGAQVWRVEETMAALAFALGDRQAAVLYASNALASAPQAEKPRLQILVSQLGSDE